MSALITAVSVEVIRWNDPAVVLPDADMTVLLFNAEWDDPVVMGWRGDGDWFFTETSVGFVKPTHWAEFPVGPKGGEQ